MEESLKPGGNDISPQCGGTGRLWPWADYRNEVERLCQKLRSHRQCLDW